MLTHRIQDNKIPRQLHPLADPEDPSETAMVIYWEIAEYQGVAGQEEDSDEDFESYKKMRKSKGRMYHDAEDEEEWMVADLYETCYEALWWLW